MPAPSSEISAAPGGEGRLGSLDELVPRACERSERGRTREDRGAAFASCGRPTGTGRSEPSQPRRGAKRAERPPVTARAARAPGCSRSSRKTKSSIELVKPHVHQSGAPGCPAWQRQRSSRRPHQRSAPRSPEGPPETLIPRPCTRTPDPFLVRLQARATRVRSRRERPRRIQSAFAFDVIDLGAVPLPTQPATTLAAPPGRARRAGISCAGEL